MNIKSANKEIYKNLIQKQQKNNFEIITYTNTKFEKFNKDIKSNKTLKRQRKTI
jgi:hypothetical protein